MMRKIKIACGPIDVFAVLKNTVTADTLWAALPLEGRVHVWGDEIYFSVPAHLPIEENAQDIVTAGDVGYWPTGTAICLFFGPTPISREGEIRPASAVNVFGTIEGDLSVLNDVAEGAAVRVEKADP